VVYFFIARRRAQRIPKDRRWREPCHRTIMPLMNMATQTTYRAQCALCLRAVNTIKSAFRGLACHLSLCRLLKVRFFVDWIPSALTNLFSNLPPLNLHLPIFGQLVCGSLSLSTVDLSTTRTELLNCSP